MDYNGFSYIPQHCLDSAQYVDNFKKQKRLSSKLARQKSVLFQSLK